MMHISQVPKSMCDKFAAGYVPMDEPPGLEEMAYKAWKEAGGIVTGPPIKEFEEWAKVELMGHVTLAGRLTEVERFGSKMARLDVPHGDGFVTQWFGGSAVYRITAVTEAVARQIAARGDSIAPISPWDYPKVVEAKQIGPTTPEERSYGSFTPPVGDDPDDYDHHNNPSNDV